MFYDKYIALCKAKNVSPSFAALEAGFSKSLITKWKTNKTDLPSPEVLHKIANYFNIAVSELLDEEIKEQPHVIEGLSLEGISPEDVKTIRAYLDMPEDQRRALAKILGVSE